MRMEGCTETIKAFRNRYTRAINSHSATVHELTSRTVEDTARTNFDNVVMTTNDDVIVVTANRDIKQDKKVTDIHASGKSVYFVEFGTGSIFADDNPMKDTYNAVRGSYGLHNGLKKRWYYWTKNPVGAGTVPYTRRVFSSKDWNYMETSGMPANRCMYNALQEGINTAETTNRGIRL